MMVSIQKWLNRNLGIGLCGTCMSTRACARGTLITPCPGLVQLNRK
jgi:hypothetical protein